MTNGGGIRSTDKKAVEQELAKSQSVEPAKGSRQEMYYRFDYLADAIDVMAEDVETFRQIRRHLELMNQTLQGIGGDIAEINRRQIVSLGIIKQYCNSPEVTDINDIAEPG